MTKVGRNDPCPCGSGKKYKNCCMLKTQEDSGAAKYTAGGKRKFKAKVIQVPQQGLAAFGYTGNQASGGPTALDRMRFRRTEHDFRRKEGPTVPTPFPHFEPPAAGEAPTSAVARLPSPDEPFKATQQDFRQFRSP